MYLTYSGLNDRLLQKYISDSISLYQGKISELPICSVGCTIGTYAGPGAIGVAFFEPENGDSIPKMN
ncbi:MAG: DegV family protein [Lachnospiraceae bacterium]|nr:DegV family protein [Lachnospiraceae bacterium]